MKYLLLILILLCSCSSQHTYYVKIDDRQEESFKMSTDSEAYIYAYTKYAIAKKVDDDKMKIFKQSTLPRVESFVLLNADKIDITDSVFFVTKELQKQSIYDRLQADSSIVVKAKIYPKYDTVGLYKSPIIVTSSKFISKEYSTYKEVKVSYKNVSSKAISAIRFKWYGENSFKEPADMTTSIDGWSGGFTDDKLGPGRSSYGVWDVMSRDGKNILIAYPYEVAFEDGTFWKLNNDQ